MRKRGREIAWVVLALSVAGGLGARAEDVPAPIEAPLSRLTVPPGLPRYEMDLRLDVAGRTVRAHERVTFTNRARAATQELIFHVYPRYHVPDADRPMVAKTLEFLRLSPEEAMDAEGRRLTVARVRVGGRTVPFQFDPQQETILIVPLPTPVMPGGSVVAEIDFQLDLPDFWGRWGQHDGITYLLNWYPVLAHHDDRGWERTPFVPWHQPWHQEAGHYTVRIELPETQAVASTGRITRRERLRKGQQRLTIEAKPTRDFALVCSDRFRVWERKVGHVNVRVLAFPEHFDNAQWVLEAASEIIPLYERWFGPYYDDEFEVAASFFGWNGNECSGLVLLDERIFRLSSAGHRYIDHLITHETCHQWWWNVVGSDGYAETFMDEGLVNCFTALRLDTKYGRNAPLIVWPRGLSWLPTIGREDLRLSGYYGWRAGGGNGAVIQDLKKMGNLAVLFSLAYDRGGKIVEMVHNRLGEERFFTFWRAIYRKYAWSTFHYEDFKRELAAFDSSTDWREFLDAWLVNHAETDWAVERVHADPDPEAPGVNAKKVTITLKQAGNVSEPTVLLCQCRGKDLLVPIWPDRDAYDIPDAHIERQGDRTWIIVARAPGPPTQVEVDPDHALLDAVPDNNRWQPKVAWRLTPFMNPLDEASQFQPYDRVSFVAGPFIDQYARGGFKIGAQRQGRWQLTAWAGTEPALREAIFGGQFNVLHWPWLQWSAGLFYEEGLYNFYNDKRHSGGRAFLRYRFLETSSFLIDDQGFAELYYGVGNEFWPGDDGRPVNQYLGAVGGRFRMSTLFPYWDPVGGRLIEATAEYGSTLLGSSYDYVRWTAEYGFVRPAPAMGRWFHHTRIAFRVYGGMGFPDTLPLFRLGGGRRLRALDLTDFEGSAVWLSTLEVRFPLWREINQDVADHVLGFRNLFSTVFCDVGESFLRGRANPVVTGVGVGLRIDVAMFAFLERASFRIDLATPVGIGPRGPTLWFGINQVF
jgi:hypothetical protein